jgi:hypothetical protein
VQSMLSDSAMYVRTSRDARELGISITPYLHTSLDLHPGLLALVHSVLETTNNSNLSADTHP